ncbi:tRNA lysidine(34) synthetase TilS [Yoonia sp. SS1-5]|uniref:tRNA(Ile)-lysidine synthase n=1 Tax=Yoonia rhodophyticola TaxID=3137370 RepID=A0AAN0NKL1_9RHOB
MPIDPRKPDIAKRFVAAIDAASIDLKSKRIGLAVSGGGDSIALMHLAARLLRPENLFVVTVNHNLRPNAAAEIALVSAQAKELGLPHAVLDWHWDKTGNLQAAARAGRWATIVKWSLGASIDAVFLGHTEDDQLETLLMRLARGSGIDGLTGMARHNARDGLDIYRPLLDVSRADLRAWLTTQKISWCDDPSNDDPRFDRVRARQMFAQLEALGLTRKRLLQTADHMQAAHGSLQRAAVEFARMHVRQDAGDLLFARAAMALDTEDAPRRVMAAALRWMNGKDYKPRFDPMLQAVMTVRAGRTATFAGCILSPESGGMRMTREVSATQAAHRYAALIDDISGVTWDGRWFLQGPVAPDLSYRALDKGIGQCPDWRHSGHPRQSLLASPSVWRGKELVSAPLAGFGNGWTAQIVADFHEHAFAH